MKGFFILLSLGGYALNAFAGIITQEQFQTHLRLSLSASKGQLDIHKKDQNIRIETKNFDLFSKINQDLKEIKFDDRYIGLVQTVADKYPDQSLMIDFSLANDIIQTFSFYKEESKSYIIDFWKEEKKVAVTNAQSLPKKLEKNEALPQKKIVKEKSSPRPLVEKKSLPATEAWSTSLYRDFRYGSAFIWAYKEAFPLPSKKIDLKIKMPDDLYPIANRKYESNEKESHLQLSINLYRQRKWGLLSKSIDLYQQKYGEESEKDLNNYLRANALIMESIEKKQTNMLRMGINFLVNIVDTTKNVELRMAIYQYLLAYYYQQNDFISLLKYSKRFFVEAKSEFAEELALEASIMIVHALAALDQKEQLMTFIQDSKVKQLFPQELFITYLSAMHLRDKKYEEVTKLYENLKNSEKGTLSPEMTYNVAEAYFQQAQYSSALKVMQLFMDKFSYRTESSLIRMRMAVCHDLLDEEPAKVLKFYEDVINKSTNPQIRYEAKVRYVGLGINRKQNLSEKDLEYIAYLDMDEDEKNVVDGDLKKLLWLTRFRLFIVQGEFEKGLAYFNSLPLMKMTPKERSVFKNDLSQLIYGALKNEYKKGNYSTVVRKWEKSYKNLLVNVPVSPMLYFTLADSYSVLQLHANTSAIFQQLTAAELSADFYPEWIKTEKNTNPVQLMEELQLRQLIADKVWPEALRFLTEKGSGFVKRKYYEGFIQYKLQDWSKSVIAFEDYLVSSEDQTDLTNTEIDQLFSSYTDALYQKGDFEKFVRNSSTIVNSVLNNQKNNYLADTQHRIMYQVIEVLCSQDNEKFQIDPIALSQKFLEIFPQSVYRDRIQYLQAHKMVEQNRRDEAERIFRNLINKKDIASYLKELSKSELSSLQLSKQRI